MGPCELMTLRPLVLRERLPREFRESRPTRPRPQPPEERRRCECRSRLPQLPATQERHSARWERWSPVPQERRPPVARELRNNGAQPPPIVHHA